MQNPENKLKVSEIYLEHYKTIMYDFMTDDQELDVSIANLRWGSCHIRSVLIGVEYQSWPRTLDVYLLFAILLGQIY